MIDGLSGNQKIKTRFADDPEKVSRKELDHFSMMRAFIPQIANIIALLEDVCGQPRQANSPNMHWMVCDRTRGNDFRMLGSPGGTGAGAPV